MITALTMRDTLKHCVAQQICANQDVYSFMHYVVDYLLEQDVDIEDIHELYVDVYYGALEEATTIREMYARYGITVQVEGHGGSQIHPRILLEPYFL